MGFIFCFSVEEDKYSISISIIDAKDNSIEIIKKMGDFSKSDEGLNDSLPYCCGWVDTIYKAIGKYYERKTDKNKCSRRNKSNIGEKNHVHFTKKFAIT